MCVASGDRSTSTGSTSKESTPNPRRPGESRSPRSQRSGRAGRSRLGDGAGELVAGHLRAAGDIELAGPLEQLPLAQPVEVLGVTGVTALVPVVVLPARARAGPHAGRLDAAAQGLEQIADLGGVLRRLGGH